IKEVWATRQLKPFLSKLFPQAATMLAEKPAAAVHGGRGPALPDPKPIPIDVAATFRNIVERAAQGEAVIMMTTRGAAEHQREIDFAAKLAALTPPVKVTDATAGFTQFRRVKSQREIEMLQHAVDITAEGFQRDYPL